MTRLAGETPPGCFVEVGVYKGGSAWHLAQVARKQRRALYLYDTFTGIPCKGEFDSHQVGDFADTSARAVRDAIPDAIVVEGVFPASAIQMPAVAFAHIDADQYQSVLESARFLSGCIVPGGLIWFDDYNCLPGAQRAVDELFEGRVRTAPISHKAYVRF